MKSKRGLLVFLAIALFFMLVSSASAEFLSIQSLIESEWVNAAILFLLIFNLVLIVMRDVFKGNYGAAIIIAIVFALGCSLAVVYYMGSFLSKVGVWLLVILVVAIAFLLFRLSQKNKASGMAFWIMGIVSAAWLVFIKKQVCPPIGSLPENVCQVVDVLAIILLIIAVIRLIVWFIKLFRGIGKRGQSNPRGPKPPKEKGPGKDQGPEGGKEPKTNPILTISIEGNGKIKPAPGQYRCKLNQKAKVGVVMPYPGWVFQRWDLNGNNIGHYPLATVFMNQDHHLTAVFIPKKGGPGGPGGPGGSDTEEEDDKKKMFIMEHAGSGSGRTNPAKGFRREYPITPLARVMISAREDPGSNFAGWQIGGKLRGKTAYRWMPRKDPGKGTHHGMVIPLNAPYFKDLNPVLAIAHFEKGASPALPKIHDFSPSKKIINSPGEKVKLNFDVEDAEKIHIQQGYFGDLYAKDKLKGKYKSNCDSKPITKTPTRFKLTATNSHGSVDKIIEVKIKTKVSPTLSSISLAVPGTAKNGQHIKAVARWRGGTPDYHLEWSCSYRGQHSMGTTNKRGSTKGFVVGGKKGDHVTVTIVVKDKYKSETATKQVRIV